MISLPKAVLLKKLERGIGINACFGQKAASKPRAGPIVQRASQPLRKGHGEPALPSVHDSAWKVAERVLFQEIFGRKAPDPITRRQGGAEFHDLLIEERGADFEGRSHRGT